MTIQAYRSHYGKIIRINIKMLTNPTLNSKNTHLAYPQKHMQIHRTKTAEP